MVQPLVYSCEAQRRGPSLVAVLGTVACVLLVEYNEQECRDIEELQS